jgi:hypothetical protein
LKQQSSGYQIAIAGEIMPRLTSAPLSSASSTKELPTAWSVESLGFQAI